MACGHAAAAMAGFQHGLSAWPMQPQPWPAFRMAFQHGLSAWPFSMAFKSTLYFDARWPASASAISVTVSTVVSACPNFVFGIKGLALSPVRGGHRNRNETQPHRYK